MNSKKAESLALASRMEAWTPNEVHEPFGLLHAAAAALREYAATMDAQPVAHVIDRDNCKVWWSDKFTHISQAPANGTPLYTHPPSPQREHITDGSPCWCRPDLNYVDPETGAKVWIHKESQ